jgi:hypothetical protein
VNTPLQLANCILGITELWHCDWVAQVAFWDQVASGAEVVLALVLFVCVPRVKVLLLLCISNLSADSLRCHFYKEGIRPGHFEEASPGVFLSQRSTFYTLENQHGSSSLLGLRFAL